MQKTKISFLVPKKMHEELIAFLKESEYGIRGKSRWIGEAIDSFVETDNFEDLVWYADKMDDLRYSESVTLPLTAKDKIDEVILRIKKEHLELEGLQSAILRASIMQRLARVKGL